MDKYLHNMLNHEVANNIKQHLKRSHTTFKNHKGGCKIAMREDYFNSVVSSLTMDDMRLLGILYDNEANAVFKAMKNAELLEAANLSDAVYRRTICRLNASKLIENASLQKMHMLYITEFGMSAIKANIEGVGV